MFNPMSLDVALARSLWEGALKELPDAQRAYFNNGTVGYTMYGAGRRAYTVEMPSSQDFPSHVWHGGAENSYDARYQALVAVLPMLQEGGS